MIYALYRVFVIRGRIELERKEEEGSKRLYYFIYR
jgi:hypothetical protein